MKKPSAGFLDLPLELRQQIYGACFCSTPEPGLLCVNHSIHSEVLHFLRKYQQTFSFHISGSYTGGLEEFSQWCFKVKGHIPRFSRMKHIILNIYPPDPNRPIGMQHIWHRVLCFSKDITSYRRIPALTVKFIESDEATWASSGRAHSTMNLPYKESDVCYSDVGQILAIFCRFVNNIDTPKIILPASFASTSKSPDMAHLEEEQVENLMTGQWSEPGWDDEFWCLDDDIRSHEYLLKQAQGRKSKAVFVKIFGQAGVLHYEHFECFRQNWPYMETLHCWERPRWRRACPSCVDCMCEKSLLEITRPETRGWKSSSDWRCIEQWHKETVDMEGGSCCAMLLMNHYIPQPEELPRWCYGEELYRRLFPQRGAPNYKGRGKQRKLMESE